MSLTSRLMALEFARSSVLSRTSGHTAVKAAAYRAGEKLIDERVGRVADYSHRSDDVGHSEVMLPCGADPALADRTALWTAVEDREDQHNRRASAQLAIDHVIALPKEISKNQHVELAKAFAESEFVRHGLVVDLAIHYHSKGNPHAHLLTTTRPLVGSTFGAKDRSRSGRFYGGQKIPDAEQLRHRWADFQNSYFRTHGIDAVVRNNNGEFKAEVHLGPAHAMTDKGIETARQADNLSSISAREQTFLGSPELIIERVSDRKSLFTLHDLYRELNTLVNNPTVFSTVKAKLDNHPSLIGIEVRGKSFFTTQKVVEAEQSIRGFGEILARENRDFSVAEQSLKRVFDRYEFLAEEQKQAASHVTQGDRFTTIVGLAGAGKSTLLKTVREAYEESGHRVTGIALAGKAAEELEHSAGIESRTIASWLLALKDGRESIGQGDVITLDEAGMVPNSTMLQVLETVERVGAKLIQVGDGEQLQAIQTGCPFRDLSIQHGYAELETIRRQRTEWQRRATLDLARGRPDQAISSYREAGRIHDHENASDAQQSLVADYLADFRASRIVLAHRRADVRKLNHLIRESLVAAGIVSEGRVFRAGGAESGDENHPYDFRPGDPVRFSRSDRDYQVAIDDKATYLSFEAGYHRVRLDSGRELRVPLEDAAGLRHETVDAEPTLVVGVGDRVLFTRNNHALGVKNGTLGTVAAFKNGRLSVAVDGRDDLVSFTHDEYSQVSLGYATTIHKSQGMTVDRAYVLGSHTMDKHLGYVALSRHRENVDVYLSAEAMKNRGLVATLKRINRQETVLDFAERHGLELDPNSPSTLQFTPISTPVKEGDMSIMEQNPATIFRRGEEQPLTLKSAKSVLELATDERMAELEEQHMQLIKRRQQTLDDADALVREHALLKPRTGILSRKEKLDQWREQGGSLGIERGNSLRALKREQETFRAREGMRRQEAEKWANSRYPEAARLVEKARVTALAKALSDQWMTIEKDLVAAQGRSDNQKSVDRLQSELNLVLNKIERNATVKGSLPKTLSGRFAKTREANTKAIQQSRSIQRGRGLSR